MNDEFEKVHNE